MKQNFDYYNRIAVGYDELHGREQVKKLELIKTEMLNNNLLAKGIFVLDIGAGTGLSSQYIDIDEVKVVSLEPAFGLLKLNKNKYRVQGVAEFLPFKSGRFEIVQSITAVHNFDDIEKAVSEMKRVNRKTNGKKHYAISILKKSGMLDKITLLLKKEFHVIKEIDEDKDKILLLEK